MSDIREILNRLNSGEISAAEVPDEMILQVAAEILFVEGEGQDEILTRLSPLQREVLSLQALLMEGDLASAVVMSEELLTRSRSKEERDLECEVRVRMERALLAVDGVETSGLELKWCTERLKAIAPGSALHGISLLNQGTWHANNGEVMMAMAVHADITRDSGHPPEIRGLSRLEVGRILTALDDLDPAMRHLWTAKAVFSDAGMVAESVVASLEWLDLALEEVVDDSPRMLNRIQNAAPRAVPGSSWIPANRSDVVDVVEDILPILLTDVGGKERNDLGLILDASQILEEASWSEAIAEKSESIQDARLLEALQS